MAVTVYECSKCGGVFNAVFGAGKSQLCRACKTGDSGASTPPRIMGNDEIRVIKAEGEPGESVREMTSAERLDRINELTRQVFENSPSLGIDYAYGPDKTVFTVVRGGSVQFQDRLGALQTGIYYNQNDDDVSAVMRDGKLVFNRPLTCYYPDGSSALCDIIDPSEVGLRFDSVPTPDGSGAFEVTASEIPRPEPVASASPHAAILNPKRKFRFAE